MLNANENKLSTGTIVNINDLSNLTELERQELFSTPMNLYEGLQIKNDLSEIKSSLTDTLSFIKNHNTKCPIAQSSINTMIDTRMKTNIKETILTSGNIAKAITAVFLLLASFGTIIFFIINQTQ